MKLTDSIVRNLKSPETGQTTYWDELPGFGIRVSQGGTRSFVLVQGQSRQRITIGRYPAISLAEARTEAKRLIAERTLGNSRVATIKFSSALDSFFELHCSTLRLSTAKETRRLLTKHFLPKWGRLSLADITPRHIISITDSLLKTPSEALHAHRVVRLFFRWAVGRQMLSSSPCDGLPAPAKERVRDRVLSDEELAEVWAVANFYPFGTIIRLLILTGQRRGEIGSFKWEWINESDRTITIPPEATKNGRRHTFPYGSLVAEILEDLPRGEFVFPARGKSSSSFSGYSPSKVAFDKKCKVEDWSLHDLRRTFATNLAALGVRMEVTEKLLNHVSGSFGGIVGVYQRYGFADEMREAVDAWEKKLSTMLKHS